MMAIILNMSGYNLTIDLITFMANIIKKKEREQHEQKRNTRAFKVSC